jgi:hypothetical protein
MQPTLQLRKKLGIEIKISSFLRKCIVGCICNSVRLIITREIPCIPTIFFFLPEIEFSFNLIEGILQHH